MDESVKIGAYRIGRDDGHVFISHDSGESMSLTEEEVHDLENLIADFFSDYF